MDSNKSIQDQLKLYREKHKKVLINDTILQKFVDKYKDKIILDKSKLAAFRITNFFKKYCLQTCANEYIIPEAKYRCRIKITENNLNEDYDDTYNIDENNIEIPYELYEPTGDPNTDKIIKESIKTEYLNQVLLANSEKKKRETKLDHNYIMIDLSIYGQNTKMPIYFNDKIYYLTVLQQNKINKMWNKVNPLTETGKKFQTLLEFSKAMSDAYNNSITHQTL